MEQPNMTYINSLSGGDVAFEEKLISIIKLEFPQEKEVYLTNMKNEKFSLAAANVHKLKHKISILGLEESYGVAGTFEEQLLKGDASLSTQFETILSTIDLYLTKL